MLCIRMIAADIDSVELYDSVYYLYSDDLHRRCICSVTMTDDDDCCKYYYRRTTFIVIKCSQCTPKYWPKFRLADWFRAPGIRRLERLPFLGTGYMHISCLT